jgi:hypothetical protein
MQDLISLTPHTIAVRGEAVYATVRTGSRIATTAEQRKRLAGELAQNSVAGPVTMGMMATSVLHWAESSGIDLARFEAPTSVFVALVAKSVFDELRSRNDSDATKLNGNF